MITVGFFFMARGSWLMSLLLLLLLRNNVQFAFVFACSI